MDLILSNVVLVEEHYWLSISEYEVKSNALTLMNDRTGKISQVQRQSIRHTSKTVNNSRCLV